MKNSDEQRLGKSIVAAQERLRQCMCRITGAASWHLAKAAKVAERPKLLARVVPHLEGDAAEKYLESLPGWIEQTRQQDKKCAAIWGGGEGDYDTQHRHLIAMLLRYDFSLRSYERFAREPAEAPKKRGKQAAEESAARMTPEDLSAFAERVADELKMIDQARAELVAGHEELVDKLAQASGAPLKEATMYARHGLETAAENFDVRRGHRFSSYAQKWIKAAIKEKMTCSASEK